jgi:hypothetical protein
MKVLSGHYFDAVRMETCSQSAASDGKSRCLPSAAVNSGFFSDPGCTQPVATVAVVPGCQKTSPTYFAPPITIAACSIVGGQLRPVMAEITSGPLYKLQGVCTQTSYATWSAAYYAWSVGAPIPPTDFAEMVYEVQ